MQLHPEDVLAQTRTTGNIAYYQFLNCTGMRGKSFFPSLRRHRQILTQISAKGPAGVGQRQLRDMRVDDHMACAWVWVASPEEYSMRNDALVMSHGLQAGIALGS